MIQRAIRIQEFIARRHFLTFHVCDVHLSLAGESHTLPMSGSKLALKMRSEQVCVGACFFCDEGKK